MESPIELSCQAVGDDRPPVIALGIMVKNEEHVIAKTLRTAMDAVDYVFVCDTGSTDGTVQVCTDVVGASGKPLHMLHTEFVDFATTRNKLLEFIETSDVPSKIDFILLLDANDEFSGCSELRAFAKDRLTRPDGDDGGFYIEQRWLYGESVDSYYNIFFIRPGMGWRYYGAVHEYLAPVDIKSVRLPEKCPSPIHIYQNRNENCKQSFVRYRNDYDVLLKTLDLNPNDPRSLFYMGQTCECLRLYNEAFHYYTRRVDVGSSQGTPEEVYHSYYRLGNLCIRLQKQHSEIIKYYGGAIEVGNRVEPMLRLCEYYLFVRKQPVIAYGYACMALFTPYPASTKLFKIETDYTYRRYNRFVVTAHLVGDFSRAVDIGRQMVSTGIALEPDIANLAEVTRSLELAQAGKSGEIVVKYPTKLNDNTLVIST